MDNIKLFRVIGTGNRTEPESYVSEQGHTIRREQGLTPNGNVIGGRWVLRDRDGTWLDHDQYRHDLFEAHNFVDVGDR